jgi:hypothetical protein
VRFALLPAYGRKEMGHPHRIAKTLAQPSAFPSEIVIVLELELVLGSMVIEQHRHLTEKTVFTL